jgi:hypothetical protein
MLSTSYSGTIQSHPSHQHQQQHRSTLCKHNTRLAPRQQQLQQRRGRGCSVHAADVSELLTPHSGYHFDGTNRRFFEGWYFKVCVFYVFIRGCEGDPCAVMYASAYRGSITAVGVPHCCDDLQYSSALLYTALRYNNHVLCFQQSLGC